jgi:type I restriction enzyme S subunit
MADSWHQCRWGSLATLEYGKALRGYQAGSGAYPVFGTNGPIGSHSEPLCPHPGVIIGRKGAYRGIHYSHTPFFVIDTAFYLEPSIELDLKWAYYQLLTHDINGMDSGSAIPSTSRDAFYALPVSVPPLSEQRAIARILGTLDDKIELNRRMNATLEEMARTLFRSWFVDFDPVHAKAEGRQPAGMDAATAALFPDSFEETELGEVPTGWEVGPLPEVLEINPPRRLGRGQIAPYLEMSNLPTSAAQVSTWKPREFSSGMRFVNGDVLLARITPCLENGKTAYVDFLQRAEVGWGSTEYIVFRTKGAIPPLYAYFLARSAEFRTFAIQNMTGTSGRQRVPTACFTSYLVVKPPQPIATAFGAFVDAALKAMKMHDDGAATLVVIRDALLPKLLSGEIRVHEAERQLEAVL